MMLKPLVVLAALLAGAHPLHAQAVLELVEPTASRPEEFTHILSVRELQDGRVLVVDGEERRLVVADLRSGNVTGIGRSGSGPMEYKSVGFLWALAGDSTLMTDTSNRRWLLLAGSRIVATVPADDPGVTAASTGIAGADLRGHVLASRFGGGDVARADRRINRSAQLRVHRATATVDTIVVLRGIEVRITTNEKNGVVGAMGVVYQSPEQALLFPDGWIAVARQDPYRIDWHDPTGAVTHGKEIPWSSPPIDDAEKQDWRRRSEELLGSPLDFDLNAIPWADAVPPFLGAALQATPDGALLVERAVWSGSNGTEYDIITRSGERQEFRIAENQSIVGFGRGTVYVSTRDEDGIQRLSRHPWR